MATCAEDEQENVCARSLLTQYSCVSSVFSQEQSAILTFDRQFECPICLACLRDPILTSCGHRFCAECINMWLQRKGGSCPVDGGPLARENLFPDNFTRREILQQRMACPFAEWGCQKVLCPLDLDAHVQECQFQLNRSPTHTLSDSCQYCGQDGLGGAGPEIISRHINLECPRVPVSCPFRKFGCRATLPRASLSGHVESESHQHLNLMTAAYDKLSMSIKASFNPSTVDCGDGSDARVNVDSGGSNLESAGNSGVETMAKSSELEKYCNSESSGTKGAPVTGPSLIKALYERIVLLEQKNREQQIQIENLKDKVRASDSGDNTRGLLSPLASSQLVDDVTLKLCNGLYVWRISHFTQAVTEMVQPHLKMMYSPSFYSSPFGYRFCVRINLSARDQSYLTVLIHLVRGDNDNYLDWPFCGAIAFTLVNQQDPKLHLRETMESRKDLAAFQKPLNFMNPRGFGYTEFVKLSDIKTQGFLRNDELILRIKVEESQLK